MSLLRKIQELAVDSKSDVGDLLRHCLILSARLGHHGFRTWVEAELNGYAVDVALPPYRVILGVNSIGFFLGPLGEQFNNLPLPLLNIPEPLRERVSKVELRQGAATMASMIRGDDDEPLISRWPGSLVAVVADKFMAGRTLMEAHIELPRHAVAGALDAIRNRVLQFALDIEQQDPDAGDAQVGQRSIPEQRVAQIFHTTIMGGTNIAVGSPHSTQTLNVQAGDLPSLRKYLAAVAVSADDLDEMEVALKSEPRPSGDNFGPKVGSWIGGMIAKATSGAWKIAVPAAAALLSDAIRWYYGLP